MASAMPISASGLSALDMFNAKAPTAGKLNATTQAKARASAQDFESVFINSMFQQMFTGLQGDGPFGGVWGGFLMPSMPGVRGSIKMAEPVIDVFEHGNEVVVTAELPGACMRVAAA